MKKYNKTENKSTSYAAMAVALTTIASLGMAMPVFADTGRDGAQEIRQNRGNNGLHLGERNIKKMGHATSTMPFVGNGQPIVGGVVSAVTGTTLTIKNASNIQYTIDATNAKIVRGQGTTALSSVVVGDSVLVQGTVNGTAIVASTIIDQTKVAGTATANQGDKGKMHHGFFGQVGKFFTHMFGF